MSAFVILILLVALPFLAAHVAAMVIAMFVLRFLHQFSRANTIATSCVLASVLARLFVWLLAAPTDATLQPSAAAFVCIPLGVAWGALVGSITHAVGNRLASFATDKV